MKRSKCKPSGDGLDQLLNRLAMRTGGKLHGAEHSRLAGTNPKEIARLAAAGLILREPDGAFKVTAAGYARLSRMKSDQGCSAVDPFRGQHMTLARRPAERDRTGSKEATPRLFNDAESPLAWLARRKGRDGTPMIEPVQFQAGERLRADFTFAQLTPRITVNWAAPIGGSAAPTYGRAPAVAETVLAAKQRFNRAVSAVGPELAGLLIDVCCFLKGIEDVERERNWPPRSAKVVLQLGLDRLARHYGLGATARGHSRAPLRIWLAPGERFVVTDTEANC